MKIALIGQKGIPAKGGGVESHVEKLATRLVKAGNEVFVYTRYNYSDKNLKEYKGVKLINLPSIGTKHLDAISHTFFACLDLVRRKVDVIHFHAIGPSSLIWLVKILKPRTPVVATFHCQDYYHKKWNKFAQVYLKFSEFICCKLSDNLITVSKGLKRYVKDKHKKEAVYIPNGIVIPEKKGINNISKWNLEEGNYILAVSRLIRHKGLHHLIKAYQKIKTDKKLVIAGDGFHTDDYVLELRELAGDNENIIFTGNQVGDTLAELLSNAYLFVQPSESEGLSIALLEAMSYKLPVLSSDIPENKEVISDTGFLFKNKNINDLAEKLEFLLKRDDLDKYGEMARKRVEEYYNWDIIIEDVLETYKPYNA